MTKRTEATLDVIISELAEAMSEYDRLAVDEEHPHERGAPCSPDQIRSLETLLGAKLPPSYRSFLERHNGWGSISGDAKILAVEDHASDWVKEKLDELATLFADFGENPFEQGALPVVLGQSARSVLSVDPRTQRPDGEMDFVAYYLCHEERRFQDFTSYLQHELKLHQSMIESEREGTDFEDEDDDEGED